MQLNPDACFPPTVSLWQLRDVRVTLGEPENFRLFIRGLRIPWRDRPRKDLGSCLHGAHIGFFYLLDIFIGDVVDSAGRLRHFRELLLH